MSLSPSPPNQLLQPRSLPPLSPLLLCHLAVGGRAPAERVRWAST